MADKKKNKRSVNTFLFDPTDLGDIQSLFTNIQFHLNHFTKTERGDCQGVRVARAKNQNRNNYEARW